MGLAPGFEGFRAGVPYARKWRWASYGQEWGGLPVFMLQAVCGFDSGQGLLDVGSVRKLSMGQGEWVYLYGNVNHIITLRTLELVVITFLREIFFSHYVGSDNLKKGFQNAVLANVIPLVDNVLAEWLWSVTRIPVLPLQISDSYIALDNKILFELSLNNFLLQWRVGDWAFFTRWTLNRRKKLSGFF